MAAAAEVEEVVEKEAAERVAEDRKSRTCETRIRETGADHDALARRALVEVRESGLILSS